MTKKYGFVLACMALVLALGFNQFFSNKNSAAKSSTPTSFDSHSHAGEKYPEPPMLTLNFPKSYDETLKQSNLVISGEVIENKDRYYSNVKDAAVNAIDNKKISNGITPGDGPAVIPTKVKVVDVLAGATDSKEITILQSEIFEGYEPKLMKGKKMVFFLQKVDGIENTYVVTHPYAGYMEIDENGKINPVYKENDFNSLSGLQVNDIKVKFKEKQK
jgi:hypothetical protein